MRRRNIGICVDSLRELPDKLCRITREEYAAMKANVASLAEDLANGRQMAGAVTLACQHLNKA